MERFLTALRAAAEPTRLRLLRLCAEGELTVSELCQILGQSQPRVSRHLKLLCEAGLLERLPEGAAAFFRLPSRGAEAELARLLLSRLPVADAAAGSDPLRRDLERLEATRESRRAQAASYFRKNAASWDRIRALHVDEAEVERLLLAMLPPGPLGDFLDVGTGTGRLLELLGPRCAVAVGVDQSREMLAVARSNLERANAGAAPGLLAHCSVRQADMYRLPFAAHSFDLVAFHQVLHFADDPAAAIREAARVLRPKGRLLMVDFAPHHQESLREQHAHRRLGFAEDEVAGWLAAAGLNALTLRRLEGTPLTVCIWLASLPPDGNAGPSPSTHLPEVP